MADLDIFAPQFLSLKKPIQLVDLHTQYQRIKDEIDQAVLSVVESTAYINGPEVHSFCQELGEYLKVKHVIPCANGTDALQIAMMALDLKPGDEILTPSFTYIATVEVIALLQLKPVFVEVDPDTFTIDMADARAKVTDKTKALVPVHLYGQGANMDEVMAFAKEFDLKVVEDTAQALGSDFIGSDGTHARLGTIGDIGTTSFFPSKNLGCYGDGGALFTNDDDIALRLKRIANHGQRVRYYHDDIGVNSRLDSIQAAILRIKLRHLDEYISARNHAADHYDREFGQLKGLHVPARASFSTHGFHQYTLKLEGINREELQAHLTEKGIPTNIYYPVPVHLQKGYSHYGMSEGDMPLTESLCAQVLSFPIHTEMDSEQLFMITNAVKEYLER